MGEIEGIGTLFTEVRGLIDDAKRRAAAAINSELTWLYWQIGSRIKSNVLNDARAEYGKQVIVGLSQRLTETYGRGWSEKQLRHCLRFAENFAGEETVSALRRELSWTHIKILIYLDNPIKRDFYVERCCLACGPVTHQPQRYEKNPGRLLVL